MNVLRVAVQAHAKVNWTLEVLGKRSDGYHEIRSVLQTISLCDTLTIEPADRLLLTVRGGSRRFQRLSNKQPETNLAYRAAGLLRRHGGGRKGAAIHLDKRIPLASGLGGGSSDAAAVLRGLRAFWELDLSEADLTSLAAELGSDVPFFVRGGTVLASGRGEVIEQLPDPPPRRVLVAWPRPNARYDKTRRMYALVKPEDWTDGSRSEQLAKRLRAGGRLRETDLVNTFDSVLLRGRSSAAPLLRRAAECGIGRPHLCGSGPAFYVLGETAEAIDRMDEKPAGALETTMTSGSESTTLVRHG